MGLHIRKFNNQREFEAAANESGKIVYAVKAGNQWYENWGYDASKEVNLWDSGDSIGETNSREPSIGSTLSVRMEMGGDTFYFEYTISEVKIIDGLPEPWVILDEYSNIVYSNSYN